MRSPALEIEKFNLNYLKDVKKNEIYRTEKTFGLIGLDWFGSIPIALVDFNWFGPILIDFGQLYSNWVKFIQSGSIVNDFSQL